jgi:hypothetical protein
MTALVLALATFLASMAVAPAAPVAAQAAPPVLTLAPSISGSPVVGGVLTATSGSWSGSPSNFWLVWQRCDAAGAGCVSVTGGGSELRVGFDGVADVDG